MVVVLPMTTLEPANSQRLERSHRLIRRRISSTTQTCMDLERAAAKSPFSNASRTTTHSLLLLRVFTHEYIGCIST